MDIIISIIFGFVQGATEFLPVSSSGHLLLLHQLFPGFELSDALAFDVALHAGTLIAVIWYFWEDCIRYASAWWASIVNGLDRLFSKFPATDITPDKPSKTIVYDEHIAWYIIVATIPAALIGFFFEDLIEQYFWSTAIVTGIMFIVVGIVFILVERMDTKRFQDALVHMKWKQAIVVGLFQVLALIPGTSRSGITLVGGMIMGLTRQAAARFSFLLSIPLIAGAGTKKGLDLLAQGINPAEIPLLFFGALTAAVTGYIIISALLQYFSTKTLRPFAWYRIVLGAVILMITLV